MLGVNEGLLCLYMKHWCHVRDAGLREMCRAPPEAVDRDGGGKLNG